MTYEFCTVTTRDHLQCEKKKKLIMNGVKFTANGMVTNT